MRLSDDIFGLLVVLAGLLMVAADLFREVPDVIGSIGAGLVAFSVLQVSEARKDRRLHLEQAAQAQIQAIEAHIRDLDETRRLLYMGYYLQHVPRGDRREIVGTLVNALVNHQGRMPLRDGLALGSRLMTEENTERVDAPWVDQIVKLTADIKQLETDIECYAAPRRPLPRSAGASPPHVP